MYSSTKPYKISKHRASFHVTREPQNMHQLGHFEGPDKIFTGDGQGFYIFTNLVLPLLSPINLFVSD